MRKTIKLLFLVTISLSYFYACSDEPKFEVLNDQENASKVKSDWQEMDSTIVGPKEPSDPSDPSDPSGPGDPHSPEPGLMKTSVIFDGTGTLNELGYIIMNKRVNLGFSDIDPHYTSELPMLAVGEYLSPPIIGDNYFNGLKYYNFYIDNTDIHSHMNVSIIYDPKEWDTPIGSLLFQIRFTDMDLKIGHIGGQYIGFYYKHCVNVYF